MMNRKSLIILLILTAAFHSCKLPDYVPDPEDLDVNPYGSYIEIRLHEGEEIKGELIAVDTNTLIVLVGTGISKNAVRVPLGKLKRFTVKFANAPNYAWSIPVYTASTLAHGKFLILTAPINLVTTMVVTDRGAKAYQHDDDEISLDELKMYARFPQGLPPDIALTRLE